MTDAEELREELRSLAEQLKAQQSLQPDGAQFRFSREALALVDIELRKLDALISGTSPLPEDKVYLSVWSLNKGFQEIGGDWQHQAGMGSMVERITQDAYALHKATRPSLYQLP